MACNIRSVAIVGFGKFGQLAHNYLKTALPKSVRLAVFTKDQEDQQAVEFVKFEDLQQFDLIVLSVPISELERVLLKLNQTAAVGSKKVVLDVCSVKAYPRQKMLELLPLDWEIVCSHPLFGPASVKANNSSLRNFSVTLENVRATEANYQAIKAFLRELDLNVLEISADEHDHYFGEPQFLTHLAAALFKGTLESGPAVFEGLKSVDLFRSSMKLLTADEALLKDMCEYNSYAKQTLQQLDQNWQIIKQKLKYND